MGRHLAAAMLLLALLVLAVACGGEGTTVPLDPDGPRLELRADGTVPVGRFNTILEAAVESWETDPGLVAERFARESEGEGENVNSGYTDPAGKDEVVVTVLVENLADDSIADLEFTVALVRPDSTWLLTEASWKQRCRPGRGHQALSTEPCI